MLSCTSPGKALLACPPSPPWNLPSFTAKSTFSSSCSCSDLPLTRQGVVLACLDSLPPHDLMLWTDACIPFRFDKGGSGVLANCSLCGNEATLSFSAGSVCSSFFTEACAILHALCWSRQHQQTCHFSSLLLLSDSRSVLATLSSPPFFLSSKSLWKIWKELSSLSPPVLSRCNGSSNTRFLWGTTRLMSWPDGERYLRPPQSLVVSLLLSLVSTLVFSRIGGVLPHRNSPSRRLPRFPPRNLCSLVTLAVSSLVYAATDTPFCYVLIFLELAELGILPPAPADIRPRTPLISFCTVQLRTLCAACSLATLCLSLRLVQALGSCPASGAPWSSAMLPSLGRGRVTTTATIGSTSSQVNTERMCADRISTTKRFSSFHYATLE